ncbi:MAG: DUF4340 domain-containing protein [Treponema sp.]|nr:DUF4340 domain-containing protein [Treponema sp.]
MKFGEKRKIVLLAVLAVLVCIYIVQLALTGKNKVKIVSIKEEPDSFVIKKGTGEEIRLYMDGDNWFVGDSKYPADESSVREMCSAVQSVKLLGVVSGSLSGEEERYGFDSSSKTVVEAFKGDKKIQTVIVGKNTSTDRQCYIQLERDDSVYLAAKALHSIFAVDVNALRSKDVYSVDSSEITSVTVSRQDKGHVNSVSFVKSVDSAAEEGLVAKESWNCIPAETADYENPSQLDSDKVSSWVRSLSSLEASEWMADDFSIPKEEASFDIVINLKDKSIELRGYEKDEETYLSCSEVPYCFKVTSYVGARFSKKPSDFSKE